MGAFLSSVTWAVGSAVYSRRARERSAFSVNFTRATIALPLFAVASFVVAGGIGEGLEAFAALRPAHVSWLFLSMAASYAVGDALFMWSTRSLGVPGALAIASSYPLWTALAGRDPLSPAQWLGLLLTVGGMGVVILNAPGTSTDGLSDSKVKGTFLALGTSLLWALNSYSVAKGAQGILAPVGNCIRMFWALLLTWGLSRIRARPGERLLIRPRELGRDFWVFAGESFAGSYFYVYGLAHSPLVLAATLSSLAPVLAVPIAWVLGLEKVSVIRTLGVLSVVLGLGLLVGMA